jgi:hypothetical protein
MIYKATLKEKTVAVKQFIIPKTLSESELKQFQTYFEREIEIIRYFSVLHFICDDNAHSYLHVLLITKTIEHIHICTYSHT